MSPRGRRNMAQISPKLQMSMSCFAWSKYFAPQSKFLKTQIWINSNNLSMFSVYGYSKDTGFDFAQFNYIPQDRYTWNVTRTLILSPSFLLFLYKENIQDWSYWINQKRLIDNILLLAVNRWQSCGKTLATWETWPHNPGKTEQDAIHATVYFVLDFERQGESKQKDKHFKSVPKGCQYRKYWI